MYSSKTSQTASFTVRASSFNPNRKIAYRLYYFLVKTYVTCIEKILNCVQIFLLNFIRGKRWGILKKQVKYCSAHKVNTYFLISKFTLYKFAPLDVLPGANQGTCNHQEYLIELEVQRLAYNNYTA